LKNTLVLLDYIKLNKNFDIKGYNIDFSNEGIDFYINYINSWLFINAYEIMKNSDDDDKYINLSQICESIAQFAQNCTVSTDYIINKSKSKNSFFTSIMGNDVYINDTLSYNSKALHHKYKAFA